MNVTSRKMTEDGAKKKEAESLDTYRKNHAVRIPSIIRTATAEPLPVARRVPP